MSQQISIGVDHSTTPPTLRINGKIVEWKDVASRPDRRTIRWKLSGMSNGNKLVAWTMTGAAIPSK